MASADPDAKVLADLSTLSEKIALCQAMLVNAGGPATLGADEALLAVIGFLEACVPRMVELIEAAAQGALREGTFEESLVVNDRLTNVLADVEKEPKDRQPLTPAASASSPSDENNSDIHQGMENLSVVGGNGSDAMLGGKTTGLESGGPSTTTSAATEDPFAGGPDLLAPTPLNAANQFTISDSMGSNKSAGAVAKAATEAADDDDDFDAFFKDRTAAP